MSKPLMTTELARAAAMDVGRRHAIAEGRPPHPWTRADFEAACKELHQLYRQFNLGPYKENT